MAQNLGQVDGAVVLEQQEADLETHKNTRAANASAVGSEHNDQWRLGKIGYHAPIMMKIMI
jgi:hypothetical protein